jgi:hypothetical protein
LRPHISLEEVGQLPRADSKEHHANEVKETGKKQKIEPHEVKQDKKKAENGQTGAMNTSEGGAFNPVYNAYDTPITPAEETTRRRTTRRRRTRRRRTRRRRTTRRRTTRRRTTRRRTTRRRTTRRRTTRRTTRTWGITNKCTILNLLFYFFRY